MLDHPAQEIFAIVPHQLSNGQPPGSDYPGPLLFSSQLPMLFKYDVAPTQSRCDIALMILATVEQGDPDVRATWESLVRNGSQPVARMLSTTLVALAMPATVTLSTHRLTQTGVRSPDMVDK